MMDTGRAPGMKPTPARGFTLIEVLAALVLMAVMSGLAWQGIDAMVRARAVTSERMAQSLDFNTALAQWETDLRNLLDDRGVPTLRFDGAALRLVRHHDAGAQVVVWQVREGRWQRWASRPVTRNSALREAWLYSQALLPQDQGWVTITPRASGWQVYFFRGGAWTNAQSAADLQPASTGSGSNTPARESLPSGVRLVLNLEGQGNLTRDMRLLEPM